MCHCICWVSFFNSPNSFIQISYNLLFNIQYRILDLAKSFFLFWPANVMPYWLLISILQLFIPINLLFRTCCIEDTRHYKIHWLSALLIFVGVIVNMCAIGSIEESTENNHYLYYSFMVIISSILDAISHTIKEALVRTQPLN